VIKDDRGWGIYDVFPVSNGQINVSTTYPGVVRAFHRHQHQFDYWKVLSGELEVCLATEYWAELYYLSNKDKTLVIEPDMWHGFRVLGNEPATLLYYVTNRYDPTNPDEERAPWDAFYDWKTINR
jgi:dTDP-4-dehydrorhamnose 3,5-epimerase